MTGLLNQTPNLEAMTYSYHFLCCQVLSYFLGMFRNALDQPDLQTKSTETSLSAQEITLALDSFLVNNKNMETMLDREVVPLLFSFIAKGKATGKEKAIESLLLISESSKGKAQIMSYVGANYGKPGIQEAAKRLGLELKRPQATRGNLLFITLYFSTRLTLMCFLFFTSKSLQIYVGTITYMLQPLGKGKELLAANGHHLLKSL